MANYTDPNDPIYQQNQSWLRPGETQEQWSQRTTGTLTQGTQTGGTYNPTTGQIQFQNQPQFNADLSNSQGKSAYGAEIVKQQEEYLQRKAKEKSDKEALAQQQKTGLEKTLEALSGVGKKREEELTNLGFNPAEYYSQQKAQIAELGTLYDDYNKTVAMRDQQISDIQGRTGGTIDFANAEVAKVNRNANVLLSQKSANINTKTAIMEATQNNWESANQFVNQAIEDYVAPLKLDYQTQLQFYQDNQQLIRDLGSDYDNAFKNLLALQQDQITQAANDAQQQIDNAFKRESLDLNWAQEKRLGTQTANEDLNSDLASIAKYGSRDKALSALNSIKTSLVNKYGESGYQQLLNEVDRLYPAPTPKVKTAPSVPTAASAGRTTRNILGEIFVGEPTQQFFGKTLVEPARAIGSFFSGLFGG